MSRVNLVGSCVLVLLAMLLPSVHAARMAIRLHSATTPSALHDELMLRSTPGSPLYQTFMAKDELRMHTQSSKQCTDMVTSWLMARGASDLVEGSLGDHLFFSLDHPFAVFDAPQVSPPKHGRRSLRVPDELSACVRFVFVASTHGNPRRAKAANDFPGMNQDPTTITSRYGVPSTPVSSSVSFSQGVAEFEGEQFYQSNIDAFNARYGAPNNTIQVSGPNHGGYFGEGNLDLEYIQTIATDAKTWWIAEKDFDFTLWVENVLQIQPMPQVLSISWGSGESGFDNSSMQSDSEEFRKLGLLGATVFAASGDAGTGSTGFFSCGVFDPTWPASSPYVTAVGGTYANALSDDELSWSGSGGGFSTVFSAPSYQTTAIQEYRANTTLPPAEYYNAQGRGIPDVAALACNFEVYSEGWGTETGTSAATPTFAAIVSRIVTLRLAAGKPALGFINPTLYASGSSVGFDVTNGNNKVSACPAGFGAAVGWDAISGLGTPTYAILLSLLS